MIKPVKFVIVGSTLYLKNAKWASGNIVISQNLKNKVYIYFLFCFVFSLHALGQIFRITIEDRVPKGFTKYSKGVGITYT